MVKLEAWMLLQREEQTDVFVEFEYDEQAVHLSNFSYGIEDPDVAAARKKLEKKKKGKLRKQKSQKGTLPLPKGEFSGKKKVLPIQKIANVVQKSDVSFNMTTTAGPPLEFTASTKEECTSFFEAIDKAIKAWTFANGGTMDQLAGRSNSNTSRDFIGSHGMYLSGANTFGKTLGRKKKNQKKSITEEPEIDLEDVQIKIKPPPPPPAQTATQVAKNTIAKQTLNKHMSVKGAPRSPSLHKRNAVMPVLAIDEEELAGQVTKKDKSTYKMLSETLDDSTTLALLLFTDFDDAAIDDLVSRLYRIETKEGQVIMTQSEIGNKFYVIEKGSFNLQIKFTQRDDDDDDGETETSLTKNKGGFFGELALLYDSPAPFTVTSKRDGVLWVIDRRAFLEITKRSAERQQLRKMQFLTSVDLFANNLSTTEIQELANAVEYRFLTRNEVVMEPSDQLKEMVFIAKGAVDMYPRGSTQPVARLFEGETYGEFALLEPSEAEYKLVASSQKSAVLVLNLDECEGLLGPLREVVTKRWREEFLTNAVNPTHIDIKKEQTRMLTTAIQATKIGLNNIVGRDATKVPTKNPTKAPSAKVEPILNDMPWDEAPPLLPDIKFKELQALTILGHGSFGKVFLVKNECKKTQYILDRTDEEAPKFFALKIMARNFIATNGWEEKADNEILAMAECCYYANSPFVLQLYHTWACPKNLYFLLEYGEGGDLYGMMKSQPDYSFEPEAAQYYIASVVNGFDVFHQRMISFRDLKPENLILNRHGHLKIADLGLAKKTTRTYTICGTPDYMAPEILRGRGHNKAVDWWALGVLVYELHTGLTPFYGETPDKIYELILAHEPPLMWQDEPMSKEAKDLCNLLLEPRATKRLGNLKSQTQGIRDHKYFSNFSWEDHAKLKTKPPIIPEFSEINDKDDSVFVRWESDDMSDWKPKVNTFLDKTPKL